MSKDVSFRQWFRFWGGLERKKPGGGCPLIVVISSTDLQNPDVTVTEFIGIGWA